jgi:ABC-type glutathione transport system ATPase component
MTAEVLAVMTDLAHDGLTMFVVAHAMRFARQVAHNVYVFGEGRVVESGPPDQIFEDRTRRRPGSCSRKSRRHEPTRFDRAGDRGAGGAGSGHAEMGGHGAY